MNKILHAFLFFLALLLLSMFLPPIWASAAASCQASGWLCSGYVIAIALTGLIVTGLAAIYFLVRSARRSAQPQDGEEQYRFPHGWTLEVGLWLVGIMAVYVYLLAKVIVPETLEETNIFWLQLLDNQMVLETSVAALAAGVGAIAATMYSYLDHAASKDADWQKKYVPWYILRPFVGSVLGVIFFWLMRGGILAVLPADGGRHYLDLDFYGLAGICALVGMFSRRAMLKLRDVFAVLFVLKDDLGEDKNNVKTAAQSSKSAPDDL